MFVSIDLILLLSLVLVAIIVDIALLVSKRKITKMRYALIVVLSVLVVAGVLCLSRLFIANKVIGTYGGSECSQITIDGVTYRADYDNSFDASDKDRLLGKVTASNGDKHSDPMYVWSVEGTDEYLYALWGYDGTFVRVE